MPNLSISSDLFMNTDEAAAMLGVHPKTLQRLARSGRITAYRVGQAMEIPGLRLVGRCSRSRDTFERAV
jgi:excisionase family DNA binding protein